MVAPSTVSSTGRLVGVIAALLSFAAPVLEVTSRPEAPERQTAGGLGRCTLRNADLRLPCLCVRVQLAAARTAAPCAGLPPEQSGASQQASSVDATT